MRERSCCVSSAAALQYSFFLSEHAERARALFVMIPVTYMTILTKFSHSISIGSSNCSSSGKRRNGKASQAGRGSSNNKKRSRHLHVSGCFGLFLIVMMPFYGQLGQALDT